jgi:hypothetical protein
MLDQILEYAEGLYSNALKNMQKGNPRRADIYALSAHSAASFVAAQKNLSADMRSKAIDLEDAAWQLSKQAHADERDRLMEPRMSGSDDPGIDDVREDIYRLARQSSKRRSKS